MRVGVENAQIFIFSNHLITFIFDFENFKKIYPKETTSTTVLL